MAKAADTYYATGRRKNAIARVWVKPGTGSVTVNQKPMADYLGRKVLEMVVESPMKAVGLDGKLDVVANCEGGGIAGQAGAVKLGIARAIIEMDPNLRTPLRRTGYLTRDPRVKERKKYGRKRARRGFQFVKR
jgi:small subunit ribosomal protein S9